MDQRNVMSGVDVQTYLPVGWFFSECACVFLFVFWQSESYNATLFVQCLFMCMCFGLCLHTYVFLIVLECCGRSLCAIRHYSCSSRCHRSSIAY